YLDRGTDDGVQVGVTFGVSRAGKTVGSCVVASVAERFATCAAKGLQVGDQIAVPRAPTGPPPLAPPPVPGALELQARREVLEAEQIPLVDFAGTASLGGGRRLAMVAISDEIWINAA